MDKNQKKYQKLNQILDKYIQEFKEWNKVSNNKLDSVWMDKRENKIFNPNLVFKLNSIGTNKILIKGKIKQINKHSSIENISEFLESNPNCIQYIAKKTINKLIQKDKNIIFILAQSINWTTNEPELLKLKDNYETSVAHYQAEHGWTTENTEILKLTDNYNTVAHLQTLLGWTTENTEILKLKNKDKISVAHWQVENGWTTENPELLKLKNNYEYSVAHIQADKGWTTEEPKILKLTDKYNKSVQDCINQYKKENKKVPLNFKNPFKK